jgi:hypothetical protein
MLTNIINIGSSLITTVARGATGLSVGTIGARPHQRLELYDFEA